MTRPASPTFPAPPSARARVRRAAERAHYDAPTIHAIIDEAWICHVAFACPDVVCMPTACWRVADKLYIHGANGSRMMKHLASGAPASVAITHLDGLVMARSAFSHAMNYRSVVIHGRFEAVSDAAKPTILEALMTHIAPGRSNDVRAPDDKENQATTVLGISLHESAAKIRNWGPRDKEADLASPAWAGVLPLRLQRLNPLTEPGFQGHVPAYIDAWQALADAGHMGPPQGS